MYIFPGTLEHLQKKSLKAFKTNAFSRSGKTEKRWNKMEQKVEHYSSVIRCQDPPPGDLLPGTGSSCSRILRLDPEQQPGEAAWKWTGMDRNGLQRLRRGTGKIFAGGKV